MRRFLKIGAALRLGPAFASIVALGMVLPASPVAKAQSVAVVANIEGTARVSNATASAPVTMLQLVSAGDTFELGGSGKVVLLYLATGHEYSVVGPATARINAASVAVLEGKAATLRVPAPEKAVRLRPERIVQAGMVMRYAPGGASGPQTASAQVTRGEIEQRRPAAAAPTAERTAYGLWLEHVGATIEARAVWRELAAEKPEQPALSFRAR